MREIVWGRMEDRKLEEGRKSVHHIDYYNDKNI